MKMLWFYDKKISFQANWKYNKRKQHKIMLTDVENRIYFANSPCLNTFFYIFIPVFKKTK